MKPLLPQNWSVVLDKIDATLAHSLQLAEKREARLASASAPLETPAPDDSAAARLAALDERGTRAEESLKSLDEVLAAEETQSRGHLSAIADLRERLAQWAARP